MIARSLVALALLASAPPALAQAPPPRAEGGVRLVEAMEDSPASVIGVVRTSRPLADDNSHAATVHVEQALAGDVAVGRDIAVAWEERAPSRAPRFAPDERVLLALEPLSGASIWLSRLPDPKERGRTLGVAMRGDAFLRGPSLGTAQILEHYLALRPEDRTGETGVAYLAQLAANAELPLAVDAVARLQGRSNLDERITAETARVLVRALLREDGEPVLQDALVRLVAQHRLVSLRPPLEALVGREELAPPVVYAALARIDGGLAPDRTARLLAQAPERYREIGARNAGGPDAPAELHALLRRDPAPPVRIGAVERLIELRGDAAIPQVSDALFDPDPGVRTAAARALGGQGAAAVPELLSVTQGTDLDAARAAVAALALTNAPEARVALEDIEATHPEASVRALAGIALGKEVGHVH